MGEMTGRVLRSALLVLGLLALAGCHDGAHDSREAADSPSEHAAQAEPTGSDTHPAWSPDGQNIAFISNRAGVKVDQAINFEIYRASADGSDVQRLTINEEFEADARWSPDGTKILFKSYRDGNDEVYVMDADGGNQQNLTNSPASDGGGVWSPDGTTILFQSNRGESDDNHFFLVDPDGSNVRPLPNDPGPGHSAAWSPDGLRIAFASGRHGNGEIYVMNADGSDVQRLTVDDRENGYPRWSPDGTTIAHTAGSFDKDRWEVILTDADGGNPRQLADNTDSGNAAFSPDGTRLLIGRYGRYGDDGGEESHLFVIDLESGEETPIPVR